MYESIRSCVGVECLVFAAVPAPLTFHVCGKQLLLCHAGKFGYYLTFILQWLNLLCANVGLVVLAGQSLKVIFLAGHKHVTPDYAHLFPFQRGTAAVPSSAEFSD